MIPGASTIKCDYKKIIELDNIFLKAPGAVKRTMKNEKLKACCRNKVKNLITWIIALRKESDMN